MDGNLDPVEIICPDVKQPGEYFNCVVDIPTGHDLTAEVIMVDNVMLYEVQAVHYFLVQYILGVSPSLVSRYCKGYSFWSTRGPYV